MTPSWLSRLLLLVQVFAADLVMGLGLLVLVRGVALLSVAAAWIVAGVGLIGASLLVARAEPRRTP